MSDDTPIPARRKDIRERFEALTTVEDVELEDLELRVSALGLRLDHMQEQIKVLCNIFMESHGEGDDD